MKRDIFRLLILELKIKKSYIVRQEKQFFYVFTKQVILTICIYLFSCSLEKIIKTAFLRVGYGLLFQ